MANIYHLQITRFEDYSTRSNDNRIKLIPIPPSRGQIFDRNGIALAVNKTIYQLEISPEKIKNLDEVFDALRPIVDLTDEDIAFFNKERKAPRRFTSIPLKSSLTEEQIARFIINQYLFPFVQIKGYQRRQYPYGSTLTHVVGYVSKINEQEIKRLAANNQLADYTATHDIGKSGVERYYENLLHGKPGYEEVEVNSRGRVVRQLSEHPPSVGKDIHLTIDLKLQQYIQNLLGDRRAAIIVMDPNNGEVLAMVSSPSYDSNLFVNGISSKDYQKLLDDPDRPLINRATQGVYPPGSTVKPGIMTAALATGVVSPATTIFDPGWWQLPKTERRYRDWKRTGHGKVNSTRAIEVSSDTFFYQIAYDLGIDRLSEWMTKFGYGEYSGIDISEEQSGLMPTREWKLNRHKQPWYQGDTIPVGIGQGYWTATPIQMVKALVTIINNGEIKTPHLLLKNSQGETENFYQHKDQKKIEGIQPEYWKLAKTGMFRVLNGSAGTARHVFKDTPYQAAGKSGTSQLFGLKSDEIYNSTEVAAHLRDHALFVAYAPYDKPKVAISIILENGGGGSSQAGAVARKIIDYALLGDQSIDIPQSLLINEETE